MKSEETCQGCGKHAYTEESCSCEEQGNASENPYKIGYDAGSYDVLQMVRDILDMPSDEIRECFGDGFETGWEVIAEGSSDFISSSYDAWLKKKEAQKAADEDEEAVRNLLVFFDKTISEDIKYFISTLNMIGHTCNAISVIYENNLHRLEIKVREIERKAAK